MATNEVTRTRLPIRFGLLIALAALSSFLASPAGTPAEAAFPGINGKIVFVSERDGNQEIYVMNADGSGQTRLTDNAAFDTSPSWSPDGSQIAFSSDRDGDWDIYKMNADGSSVVQLTDDPATDSISAWSPDGRRIAFGTYRDGGGGESIYVMDADGSDPVQVLHYDDGWLFCCPDWSPDGTQIAAASAPFLDIYLVNVDSGEITRLEHSGRDSWPSWSPDGTRIAFSGTHANGYPPSGNSDYDLFVMTPDGTHEFDITDEPSKEDAPSWSPDGLFVTFSSDRGDNTDIYSIGVDGTQLVRLTEHSAWDGRPDWQRLLLGDVSCRDGVTSVDSLLLLQYGAGLLPSLACQDRADVNNDGAGNAIDAQLILQFVAGLIDSLPP